MHRWVLRARMFLAILTGRSRVQQVSCGGLQLNLLDLRPVKPRRTDLRSALRDALCSLSQAGEGFGELVTDHLSMLVAADVPRERVLHTQRAYVCRFDGDEAEDGLYLACLLVWAATSSRLARDQEAHRTQPDKQAIRAAAQAAQLRFLRHFSDWEVRAAELGIDP